jgi:hypothetical protein
VIGPFAVARFVAGDEARFDFGLSSGAPVRPPDRAFGRRARLPRYGFASLTKSTRRYLLLRNDGRRLPARRAL